jgi:hypothetical protein
MWQPFLIEVVEDELDLAYAPSISRTICSRKSSSFTSRTRRRCSGSGEADANITLASFQKQEKQLWQLQQAQLKTPQSQPRNQLRKFKTTIATPTPSSSSGLLYSAPPTVQDVCGVLRATASTKRRRKTLYPTQAIEPEEDLPTTTVRYTSTSDAVAVSHRYHGRPASWTSQRNQQTRLEQTPANWSGDGFLTT